MPIVAPKPSAAAVDLKPLTDRVTKAETDLKATAQLLTDEIAVRNKFKSVRRSVELPNFDLEWEVWIRVIEDLAASTIEVVEFARTGKFAAMPMVQRKLALVPSDHANANALAGGVYENGLPRGVSINYKPKIDAQNTSTFTISFLAGTLTSYQYEGLDANNVSLDIASGSFRVNDTSLTFTPFYGNANIVKTKWTFTYSDAQSVSYIVPVVRQ